MLNIDPKSGQYQLEYSDFKGVFSDKPMYKLGEGEFAQLDGVIIKENKLCSVAWTVPNPIFITNEIWGSLPPGIQNPIIQTYFYIYGVLYLVDVGLNIYVLAPPTSIDTSASVRRQFFWCASYNPADDMELVPDFDSDLVPVFPPIPPHGGPIPQPPPQPSPPSGLPPAGQYWIVGYKGVKVINGTAYIAGLQYATPSNPDTTPFAALFAFNPYWTPTLSVISVYSAGLFLGELDGHLIQCNVVQPSDTPEFNYCKFSWSATDQYNQWDASMNYGAGYNVLPSIEDVITGFINIANIGYVFRTQGCTQVTPINSGEQPFDFSNLTESTFGLGVVYPNTIDLWGDRGCFVSDTDIFLVTGQGFQPIGSSAKDAIFQDINNLYLSYNLLYPYTQEIYGVLCPTYANLQPYWVSSYVEDNGVRNLGQSPELTYHIIIMTGNISNGGGIGYLANPLPEFAVQYPPGTFAIVWSCNLTTGAWTRSFIPAPDLGFGPSPIQPIPFSIYDYTNQNHTSQTVPAFPVGRYPAILINNIPLSGENFQSTLLTMAVNDIGTVDQNYANILPVAPANGVNIVCKQELMGTYQNPTNRGVLVRACGAGTLSIYLNNMYYGQVVINSPIEQDYLCSTGVDTPVQGLGVQIRVSTLESLSNPFDSMSTVIAATTFDGFITKIYAEGAVTQAPIF